MPAAAPAGAGAAAGTAEAPGAPGGTLAIVAGTGALPREIVGACREAGRRYLLVLFPDCEAAWMAAHPRQHHRFERVGALFRGLGAAGVDEVVFAGAMHRPRLRPWTADLTALALLPRALALLAKGDDAMLRGFAAIFERRGIRLTGPAAILGTRATLPEGPLGRRAPGPGDWADARRAAAIVRALGPLDVGQGAVVANGLCLGIEAIEGTDIMLARVAALPPGRRRRAPPPSGVLVKMPKPGQDRRLDMPAIGPDTVRAAKAAGLRGIVGLAGATLVIDRAETGAVADALGLFVVGAGEAALGGGDTPSTGQPPARLSPPSAQGGGRP
ncbi:MAG: UDP-2,3-diacylglucosamine diphosphatase LpxI [Pseudomonadota bacterium]